MAPDTGTLRGDVIALLGQANKKRARMATLLFTSLGDYYRQTDTSFSDLIASAQGGRDGVLEEAILRAVARGEIRPDQISERIARLPFDLLRHEVLMTLQPVPDEAIEEIVDIIFLPLVHRGSPPDDAQPGPSATSRKYSSCGPPDPSLPCPRKLVCGDLTRR